jgi:hypothetical protein
MAWQSLHDIYSTKVLSPAKQESAEVKLSNVYYEQVVHNNNATTLEPRQEEWKSLSDVFTDNIIRKPLSESKVTLTIDDQTHEFDSLSDEYINGVVKRMHFLNSGVERNFKTWIEKGGWAGSEDRVLEQLNTIINQLQAEDIQALSGEISSDIAAILEFTKKDTLSNFILDQKNTNKDLLQVVRIPNLKHLNDINFIAKLFQIVFPINQVNIGPGEVALSLLTSAVKPTYKGDLKVGGLDIEFKGSKGRVGKGKEESRVLNDRIAPKVGKEGIKEQQKLLFIKLKDILKSDLSVDEVFKTYILKGYITSNLYKVLQSIDESNNLDDFYKKVKKEHLTEKGAVESRIKQLQGFITQSMQISQEQNLNIPFKEYADKYLEAIKAAADIFKLKEGAETQQFRTYFEVPDYVISSDEKIDTICDYAKEKSDKLRELVGEYFIEKKLLVEQIITAISIANYHREENFNYIIFADTDPSTIRSGKIPCKIIGPMQDDFIGNVQLAINNMGNLTVYPNSDRGGFQVKYEPPVVQDAEVQGNTDGISQGDTGQYMQSTYGVPLIRPGVAANDKAKINTPI